MKTYMLLISMLVFSVLLGCKPYQLQGQGIAGQVTWLEGNQMPMVTETGKPDPKAKPKPIQRKVRVYPLVKFADLKLEDGLFTMIAEKPLAEVESDEKGNFSISLSPGRYSVFIVEEAGLFANVFDGDGNVNPVTVKENEWTLLDVVVNYKAVY